MREVGPRAVPDKEAHGKVGVGGRVRVQVPEDIEAVVVLRWIAVLRREPVVYGGHNGGKFTGEAAADGVVGPGIGAEEGEAATVEEHNDRQLLVMGRRLGGLEEAKPEVAGRIDEDVGGLDTAKRGGTGGSAEVKEAEKRAVDGAVAAAGEVGNFRNGGEGDPGSPR